MASSKATFTGSRRQRAGSILCSRMRLFAKCVPLGTITEQSCDSIFNINVKGVLFTVSKTLLLLSAQRANWGALLERSFFSRRNSLKGVNLCFRAVVFLPAEHGRVSGQPAALLRDVAMD
jgi:hypothetical protein